MSATRTFTTLRLASMALLSSCGPAEGDPPANPVTTATTIGGSATGETTGGANSTGVGTTAVGTSSMDTAGSTAFVDGSTSRGAIFDVGDGGDVGMVEDPGDPLLWYSVGDRLVYIELDPADGSVALLVPHEISNGMEIPVSGTGITMLDDGGLLIARGPGTNGNGDYFSEPSLIYHAPSPPTTVAGTVEFELLGPMPDNVAVEGLHVDCEGLIYVMDSGTNSASANGNRLLRFTGDVLGGELSYEVVTDLSMASVADIDDMAPGIDAMGEITDSQGFAIDSGTVHDFDYLSGTGNVLGSAGTFGIHALGGALFDDDIARLYVMNSDAELFEVDPVTLASSGVLATGPDVPTLSSNGNSGLAGPLTACETGFPPQ